MQVIEKAASDFWVTPLLLCRKKVMSAGRAKVGQDLL